jgi:hypothetical protein
MAVLDGEGKPLALLQATSFRSFNTRPLDPEAYNEIWSAGA